MSLKSLSFKRHITNLFLKSFVMIKYVNEMLKNVNWHILHVLANVYDGFKTKQQMILVLRKFRSVQN